MVEVEPERIESELESALPGIEVEATVKDEILTITTELAEDSPLTLKPGKEMPGVRGGVDYAEDLKEELKEHYFENFTEESLEEAGAEMPKKKTEQKPKGVVTVLKNVAEDVKASKITKASAEARATDVVLDWINEEFPGEFEEAGVDVDWHAREYRLSARVSPSAKPNYVDYSFAHSAPMEEPGELLNGFRELRKLLRKDLTEHPEITERMDYLRKARKARLEAGELDIERLLFPAEEMRTINSVSPEEVTSIFVMHGMVSKRLWAAQHVMNCKEGMSAVCAMVEDMVAAGPGGMVNPAKWEALNEAWEEYQEGTFDAVSFVEEQVEFVSKEEEERKKLLEAWPTIPAGWEPVSEMEIKRSDPDARIEIKSTDNRFETRATVAGEEYEVREAVTEGGARTDARILAEEINEKGYGFSSSSASESEEREERSESKSVKESSELKERMRKRI